MTTENAGDLIKKAFTKLQKPVIWADLGCGSGVFTRALATLLPASSQIFAVDRNAQTLTGMYSEVKITFRRADFEKDSLNLPSLDGVLIANALHYVKDKIPFLHKIKKHLNGQGEMILIEYDTEVPNQWVPYPVPFNKLKQIVLEAGFSSIEKMGEVRSAYNNGNMYSCVVKNA